MAQVPSSPTRSSSNSSNHVPGPTLSTDVDDPSHPLYHHRRIVTDFDYGDILGEGSYSTVKYLLCISLLSYIDLLFILLDRFL
jgi:3-phosphoinositide dependent protein kinase-1